MDCEVSSMKPVLVVADERQIRLPVKTWRDVKCLLRPPASW